MPPIMGAAAFLMADFLQVAYTDVVLAALIPALLYYGALLIVSDLVAAKRGIQRVAPAHPGRRVRRRARHRPHGARARRGARGARAGLPTQPPFARLKLSGRSSLES
jgi:TRAP-type uncharacterized transport system fused permease subunit